jgi:hypothetical protein
LGPTRVPPTAEETDRIKRECAAAIVDALPSFVRNRFFATADEDVMRADVAADLDLLGDPHINKHLIVSAIELLVMRLFPELTVTRTEV